MRTFDIRNWSGLGKLVHLLTEQLSRLRYAHLRWHRYHLEGNTPKTRNLQNIFPDYHPLAQLVNTDEHGHKCLESASNQDKAHGVGSWLSFRVRCWSHFKASFHVISFSCFTCRFTFISLPFHPFSQLKWRAETTWNDMKWEISTQNARFMLVSLMKWEFWNDDEI